MAGPGRISIFAQDATMVGESTPFNPMSLEYKAIEYAAIGDIANLRRYFPDDIDKVNTLVRVDPTQESYYSPLHYALKENQWLTVAFLLNQGCDWNLRPMLKGQPKLTAIEKISSTPDGLKNILEAYLHLDESVAVDSLFLLISDPAMAVERRREVLFDRVLCPALSSKLTSEESLLIMTSLQIGSFTWKNTDTDFKTLAIQPSLDFSATINCSQMLAYATLLRGEMKFWDLTDAISPKLNLTEKVHRKIVSTTNSVETRHHLRLPLSITYAENFGLIRDQEHLLDLKNPPPGNIHVFYAVGSDGFVEHYGLYYRSSKGDIVLHIDDHTRNVARDSAEYIFGTVYKKKRIYWSMLPWCR